MVGFCAPKLLTARHHIDEAVGGEAGENGRNAVIVDDARGGHGALEARRWKLLKYRLGTPDRQPNDGVCLRAATIGRLMPT